MIDEFRAAFQELIDASVSTDPRRFPAAVQTVLRLAPEVDPGERELALEALGPFIGGGHTAPGITADLCVVAGALVEMGADPGPAGVQVMALLRGVGQGAAVFLHAWDQTGGGRPPDPDDVTAAAEERVAVRLAETAPTATVCWWTVGRYGLAAKTMLSQSSVRSAVRSDPELRAELVAVANQLSGALPEFGEIRALLRMAEATSALVLDRGTGRGFRVLFDGIGDNFQLHSLLADALVGPEGRGLAGRRPDPRWVAAFRDAGVDPQARVVEGWWNLVALDGSWVRNEGVPADIPSVDGEHVLVLEEQPFPRSWNAGRRHPMVQGWLEVEEEISADEAGAWWQRAVPAASGARTPPDPGPEAGTGGAAPPEARKRGPEEDAAAGEEHSDAAAGLDLGSLVRPYVETAAADPAPAPAPSEPEAFAPAERGPGQGGAAHARGGLSSGPERADQPLEETPPGGAPIGDGGENLFEERDSSSTAPETAFPPPDPDPGEEPAAPGGNGPRGAPPPDPGGEDAPAGAASQPVPPGASPRPRLGLGPERPLTSQEPAPECTEPPVAETAALPALPGAAEAGESGSEAGAPDAAAEDEEEAPKGAPSSLPPLPPGVSKSAAWGPTWL